MPRRFTSLILCVLVLQVFAYAQLTTGTVQGTVQDQSNAVVPGVELALLNVDTNLALTQHTNNLGAYVFSNVPPGTYRLRAILDGFKTAETTGLVVEVNRNTVLNVTIEPGDLKESVQVVAAADIIHPIVSRSNEHRVENDHRASIRLAQPARLRGNGARC